MTKSREQRRVAAALSVAALAVGGVVPFVAFESAALGVENRLNLHFETGPLMTLDQPAFVQGERKLQTMGAHFRLGFELAFSEWAGLDIGWAPNVVINEFAGAVDTQQHISVGARVRPWWNRTNGYLLSSKRSPDQKLRFADYFSDIWIDAHFGVVPSGHTRLAYDVGIGARMPVVSPIQVGVFVRFQQLFAVDGDFDAPTYKQLSAGLEFSAGFSPVHRPADADGDGVPDSADQCPHSPKGALINAQGCESKKQSSPPPRCGDTDLDGVCDGQDECADTPLGTAVDAAGCPTSGGTDGTNAAPPPQ
jgi:hypothetical protein